MSVASSNVSMMSVSVLGQEMGVDAACDTIFKQLQDTLNNSHLKLRELMMGMDRDDYMDTAETAYELTRYCDEFADLMKELKSISKQLLGPCPKEDRDEYKTWSEGKKQLKAQAKLEEQMKHTSLENEKKQA